MVVKGKGVGVLEPLTGKEDADLRLPVSLLNHPSIRVVGLADAVLAKPGDSTTILLTDRQGYLVTMNPLAVGRTALVARVEGGRLTGIKAYLLDDMRKEAYTLLSQGNRWVDAGIGAGMCLLWKEAASPEEALSGALTPLGQPMASLTCGVALLCPHATGLEDWLRVAVFLHGEHGVLLEELTQDTTCGKIDDVMPAKGYAEFQNGVVPATAMVCSGYHCRAILSQVRLQEGKDGKDEDDRRHLGECRDGGAYKVRLAKDSKWISIPYGEDDVVRATKVLVPRWMPDAVDDGMEDAIERQLPVRWCKKVGGIRATAVKKRVSTLFIKADGSTTVDNLPEPGEGQLVLMACWKDHDAQGHKTMEVYGYTITIDPECPRLGHVADAPMASGIWGTQDNGVLERIPEYVEQMFRLPVGVLDAEGRAGDGKKVVFKLCRVRDPEEVAWVLRCGEEEPLAHSCGLVEVEEGLFRTASAEELKKSRGAEVEDVVPRLVPYAEIPLPQRCDPLINDNNRSMVENLAALHKRSPEAVVSELRKVKIRGQGYTRMVSFVANGTCYEKWMGSEEKDSYDEERAVSTGPLWVALGGQLGSYYAGLTVELDSVPKATLGQLGLDIWNRYYANKPERKNYSEPATIQSRKINGGQPCIIFAPIAGVEFLVLMYTTKTKSVAVSVALRIKGGKFEFLPDGEKLRCVQVGLLEPTTVVVGALIKQQRHVAEDEWPEPLLDLAEKERLPWHAPPAPKGPRKRPLVNRDEAGGGRATKTTKADGKQTAGRAAKKKQGEEAVGRMEVDSDTESVAPSVAESVAVSEEDKVEPEVQVRGFDALKAFLDDALFKTLFQSAVHESVCNAEAREPTPARKEFTVRLRELTLGDKVDKKKVTVDTSYLYWGIMTGIQTQDRMVEMAQFAVQYWSDYEELWRPEVQIKFMEREPPSILMCVQDIIITLPKDKQIWETAPQEERLWIMAVLTMVPQFIVNVLLYSVNTEECASWFIKDGEGRSSRINETTAAYLPLVARRERGEQPLVPQHFRGWKPTAPYAELNTIPLAMVEKVKGMACGNMSFDSWTAVQPAPLGELVAKVAADQGYALRFFSLCHPEVTMEPAACTGKRLQGLLGQAQRQEAGVGVSGTTSSGKTTVLTVLANSVGLGGAGRSVARFPSTGVRSSEGLKAMLQLHNLLSSSSGSPTMEMQELETQLTGAIKRPSAAPGEADLVVALFEGLDAPVGRLPQMRLLPGLSRGNINGPTTSSPLLMVRAEAEEEGDGPALILSLRKDPQNLALEDKRFGEVWETMKAKKRALVTDILDRGTLSIPLSLVGEDATPRERLLLLETILDYVQGTQHADLGQPKFPYPELVEQIRVPFDLGLMVPQVVDKVGEGDLRPHVLERQKETVPCVTANMVLVRHLDAPSLGAVEDKVKGPGGEDTVVLFNSALGNGMLGGESETPLKRASRRYKLDALSIKEGLNKKNVKTRVISPAMVQGGAMVRLMGGDGERCLVQVAHLIDMPMTMRATQLGELFGTLNTIGATSWGDLLEGIHDTGMALADMRQWLEELTSADQRSLPKPMITGLQEFARVEEFFLRVFLEKLMTGRVTQVSRRGAKGAPTTDPTRTFSEHVKGVYEFADRDLLEAKSSTELPPLLDEEAMAPACSDLIDRCNELLKSFGRVEHEIREQMTAAMEKTRSVNAEAKTLATRIVAMAAIRNVNRDISGKPWFPELARQSQRELQRFINRVMREGLPHQNPFKQTAICLRKWALALTKAMVSMMVAFLDEQGVDVYMEWDAREREPVFRRFTVTLVNKKEEVKLEGEERNHVKATLREYAEVIYHQVLRSMCVEAGVPEAQIMDRDVIRQYLDGLLRRIIFFPTSPKGSSYFLKALCAAEVSKEGISLAQAMAAHVTTSAKKTFERSAKFRTYTQLSDDRSPCLQFLGYGKYKERQQAATVTMNMLQGLREHLPQAVRDSLSTRSMAEGMVRLVRSVVHGRYQGIVGGALVVGEVFPNIRTALAAMLGIRGERAAGVLSMEELAEALADAEDERLSRGEVAALLKLGVVDPETRYQAYIAHKGVQTSTPDIIFLRLILGIVNLLPAQASGVWRPSDRAHPHPRDLYYNNLPDAQDWVLPDGRLVEMEGIPQDLVSRVEKCIGGATEQDVLLGVSRTIQAYVEEQPPVSAAKAFEIWATVIATGATLVLHQEDNARTIRPVTYTSLPVEVKKAFIYDSEDEVVKGLQDWAKTMREEHDWALPSAPVIELRIVDQVGIEVVGVGVGVV